MRLFCALLSFLLFLPLTAKAEPGVMEVFVSIAPQRFVVDRIGGLHVRSHLLVDKGQDPHTFEPTPRRLIELGGARLYFTVGLEFERQLTARLGKSFAGLRFVAMDKGIDKLPMGEHRKNQVSADATQEEKDPHIWLSPLLFLKMAENTANALAEEDPTNAADYEGRLKDLREELLSVHRRLTEELRPFKGRAFYVFHPAFGYFAATYGLIQRAVEEGGRSPSPRQLATLTERARREKVRIIFVQPQFDKRGAESIAKAIDGAIIYLDALSYDVPGSFIRIAEDLSRSFQ